MQFLRKTLSFAAMIFLLSGSVYATETYDLVVSGGRVIDPETKLDAVRNIGIQGGSIVKIASEPLSGNREIRADGLVVTPGFIDIHSHGQNTVSQTYQVHDGVTTALDLEVGAYPIEKPLSERKGHSYIHYGYSAGFGYARLSVKGGDFKRAFHEKATGSERAAILQTLESQLDQGGIGIGLPLDYFSLGVDHDELESVFKLAARRGVPLFVHIRMYEDVRDPTGFQELIDLTRQTNASLHMVHITSTALQKTGLYLQMLDKARAEGLDITTEVYPYTAASTGINSGIFDHNWQPKLGITYQDIEWPPTGKRFTGKEMWDEYRAKYPTGTVITHAMKESWIQQVLQHDGVIIASDGMLINALDERAHPRGMGTYARILGRYVRDLEVLSLPDAIARMTYLPAKRLEDYTPVMRRKGRIQVGADADITIFDPATVADHATFQNPNQYSEGIEYVIVSGVPVIEEGDLKTGLYPGQALTTLTK